MVGFSYHLTTHCDDFNKLCPPAPATETGPMSPFEGPTMLYGQWTVDMVSSLPDVGNLSTSSSSPVFFRKLVLFCHVGRSTQEGIFLWWKKAVGGIDGFLCQKIHPGLVLLFPAFPLAVSEGGCTCSIGGPILVMSMLLGAGDAVSEGGCTCIIGGSILIMEDASRGLGRCLRRRMYLQHWRANISNGGCSWGLGTLSQTADNPALLEKGNNPIILLGFKRFLLNSILIDNCWVPWVPVPLRLSAT